MHNDHEAQQPRINQHHGMPPSSNNALNWVSAVVIIGFLGVIGGIFYRNLYDQQFNRDGILLRQVELLNLLKTSNDEQEMQQVVNEYDSLARVLEVIDN